MKECGGCDADDSLRMAASVSAESSSGRRVIQRWSNTGDKVHPASSVLLRARMHAG